MKYNKKYQQDQEQSEQQCSRWGRGSRKYSRINSSVKDRLIFLIIRNNMSIKQAAQYLKVNYSSAKFIFSRYRNKNQQCDLPQKGEQCEYEIVKLKENEDDGIQLRYTVGGNYEGSTNKVVTANEIYQMRSFNGTQSN